jgi:hypothetical protein
MPNVMKIDEIEGAFPDEWILVIEPDIGPDLEVRSGVVAAHSKDRDEIDRRSLELRPRHSAIWFNGQPSDDTVMVL